MRTIESYMRHYPRPARLFLSRGVYRDNGRVAILLNDFETGEGVATATVNLPGEDIPEGQVAIKDYSENEGVAETLIRAGIIESVPVRTVRSGFVEIGIYRLREVADEEA